MPRETNPNRQALDDSLANPTEAYSPRYTSQSGILHDAVHGDQTAIESLFHYLSSSNRDLRTIIQSTLHDSQEAATWQALLPCLAALCEMDRWVDTGESGLATWLRRQMLSARKHPGSPGYDFERIQQGLVEAFVLDDSERECQLKTAVLYEALSWRQLRPTAGYLLGMRGDIRAVPILEEMVGSGSRQQALWAIHALAALNDELCGHPLVMALALDREELHHEAQRALGELGRKAEPALVAALDHPDSHIRWHAARTLGQIGDDRAVDALASGLYDENQAVRWTSARVLANMEGAAIPAILGVLCCHPITEPFRQAAFHALHSMPSRQTQVYLQPLLQVLNSPGASVAAPALANRMLAEWGRRD
jgi:hypothetical protein